MCGGSWIRRVDIEILDPRSARFVTVHPVEKTRNITRVIILVITVDLSFYHILSCSIIFYHSIIPDSSLPDHSITPVAIDLLYLLVIEKPGADRIHLLILVNLPTLVGFNLFQHVCEIITSQVFPICSTLFYHQNGNSCFFFLILMVHVVYIITYIYIYSTTQFGKPINSILSLTRHGSSDKSSNIGRLWQCVYHMGFTNGPRP